MEKYKNYFRNKKITVMGLGVLGRGVGDVAFLAECGANLIVTDKKTRDELGSSLEQLARYTDIEYRLDGHIMEDFRGRDMILVAPSVPLDSPFVAEARKEGTGIMQSAALFALLSGVPIIGVTGTRGKSTVTHMIHHTLTLATGEHVLLGGNIRGVSNLQLLKEVKDDSLAVMELDSWQLQGFGWAKVSPQIAVFTNFMEDHMNYYHGDMNAYFHDKAQIFRHQKDGDTLVTTHEVFVRAEEYARTEGFAFLGDVELVDDTTLPDDVTLRVPGLHNRLNAALAMKALMATGLTEEETLEGLSTFAGVEGRLQYLMEINGVKVYNDNNATTPYATMTGLGAVAHGKNVVLIAGGAYKEIDPMPLIPALHAHAKHVCLLSGTGTNHLRSAIEADTRYPDVKDITEVCGTLEGAVQHALTQCVPGDVLLFSPGFASFGMFKNEYDRNDQFMSIMQSYAD